MRGVAAHARIGAVVLAVATLAAGSSATALGAERRGRPVVDAMLADVAAARVAKDPATGVVTFLGADTGRWLERDRETTTGDHPVVAARSFLGRHAPLFGIDDARKDLRHDRAERLAGGRSVVRFTQVHRGVPVLAGELVAQVHRSGHVTMVSGETSPDLTLDVAPAYGPGAAARAALRATSAARGVDVRELRATPPALFVYDPRLIGASGARARLVWRVDVRSDGRVAVDDLVLVDARTGTLALRIDQVRHHAGHGHRYVCDHADTAAALGCTSSFARQEGDPEHAVADVNKAYTYAGEWREFFSTRLARSSFDGLGGDLRTTVRYCEPAPGGGCMTTAFWAGEAVFSSGMVTDDIVGHELTHGITTAEPDFFYFNQSGALDESFADIFGEFIDQLNAGTPLSGDDSAAARWLLGEDFPPPPGAQLPFHFRDMQDPSSGANWGISQPDRMRSSSYFSWPDDNYGVHVNSGVGNKAAYLIVDGDTFNGRRVTGIGLDKAARVYYEALVNILTSGSDYADLFHALQQACANLVGAGSPAITSADCVEVRDAVVATEMHLDPTNTAADGRGEAQVCPPTSGPVDLFFDDFQPRGLASPRWSASGTWAAITTYATSGTYSWNAPDDGSATTSTLAMVTPVTLPATGTAYLRFRHAHEFEVDGAASPGGGIVQYSTDGGTSWADAGALFDGNGYDGTIDTGTGMPLNGVSGFVGHSVGYFSSRAALGSLAGQAVVFRFVAGSDADGHTRGWFIDDVRIHTCTGSPETEAPGGTITIADDPDSFVPGATAVRQVDLELTASDVGGSGVQSMSFRNDAGTWSAWEPFATGKAWTVPSGDGIKTVSVRYQDVAGNVSAPESDTILLDTTPPVASALRAGFGVGARIASGGGVPVRLTWTASDAHAGVRWSFLTEDAGWGGFHDEPIREATHVVAPSSSVVRRYHLKVVDNVSNETGILSTPGFTVRRYEESTAAPTLTFSSSGWTTSALTGASGGSVRRATAAGSWARFKVKARAIGLVSTLGPDRGRADVYLDGTKVATLDLYVASATTRRIVWSRTFTGTPVSHTVELRVLGTKNAASTGRRVDFDAAVALR